MERVTSEIPVRVVDDTDDGAALSSPNSAVSSFQMDFCFRNSRKSCEGASDEDDENGSTRKKLRLSKQQSVFLEESFKEHTTLNPVILTFLFSLYFLDNLLIGMKYFLILSIVNLFKKNYIHPN